MRSQAPGTGWPAKTRPPLPGGPGRALAVWQRALVQVCWSVERARLRPLLLGRLGQRQLARRSAPLADQHTPPTDTSRPAPEGRQTSSISAAVASAVGRGPSSDSDQQGECTNQEAIHAERHQGVDFLLLEVAHQDHCAQVRQNPGDQAAQRSRRQCRAQVRAQQLG
jgi:hypothetical protein